MRQIRPNQSEVLFNVAATRSIERMAATNLPPHHLMAIAGLAIARLARALAPHADCIWIACGPGNNGGDGLAAATHLHQWTRACSATTRVVVTHWTGSHTHSLPSDAQNALLEAKASGVEFVTEPPETFDLGIDAVFGIGLKKMPKDISEQWIMKLRNAPQKVLCVDVPSGLDADTGTWLPLLAKTQGTVGVRHTLSLLTIKPGLFTASGRDAAGQVWFDDLQVSPAKGMMPTAYLNGRAEASELRSRRLHSNHKGSFGDVLVVGGQNITVNGSGMTGAAVLAARSALHAGAGRVYVSLLGDSAHTINAATWDPESPALMFRDLNIVMKSSLLTTAAVVCGCGGGTEMTKVLPQILSLANTLVLDADALNALAIDSALQVQLRQRSSQNRFTVLTPHPLEAARLLNCSISEIMADRLHAAKTISDRFTAVCVLKGSGTVISAPNQIPLINPTGNASLGTAGTGDVLAGMLGSALAMPGLTPEQRLNKLAQAVFQHGWLADQWEQPGEIQTFRWKNWPMLSASRLADQVGPIG